MKNFPLQDYIMVRNDTSTTCIKCIEMNLQGDFSYFQHYSVQYTSTEMYLHSFIISR